MTKLLVATLSIVLIPGAIFSQQIYHFYLPGDWVSFTNTRYVTAIARGFDTVYFGTTGGVLRYNITSEKWLDPLTISDGMPENRIKRLAVDRLTDEIWIETTNFTSFYNSTAEEWWDNEPFNDQLVQSPGITVSQLPQLITPFGYNYFPQGYLVSQDLMEYPINKILLDEYDIAWMGFWGLGAAKSDIGAAQLELLPFGPFDSDVADLIVDGDDIWFLGGGDGLPGAITHCQRDCGKWEYFEPRLEPGIVSDQFYALAYDSKNVWIGTEFGLVHYDKKSQRFTSYTRSDGIYGDRVTAILATNNNVIVGTRRGLTVLDLNRDTIYIATGDNIRNRQINDLAIRHKTIYAATNHGIYYLNWGSSQWLRYTLPAPVLKGAVYEIEILDSTLYAVSNDGVVIVNLNDDNYELFDRHNEFFGVELDQLLVHQGVIWVGGVGGLYRFNRHTGNWYQYTISDGLISSRVTALAGDAQYIWIGTDRGASRFRWNAPDRRDCRF